MYMNPSRGFYHPQVFLYLRDTSIKKMFKPLIAAVAAAPLFAGAAFAGPYVNVEANASYPDGEYTTATTDIHFGFDGGTEDGKIGYYVQGGPAIVAADGAENSTRFSGKAGVGIPVSDALGVYGELSFITAEDEFMDDLGVGGKLGLKYNF